MDVQFVCRMEDFEEISEAADGLLNPRAGRIRKAYLLLGIACVVLPILAGGSIWRPELSLWWTVPFGVWLIISAVVSRPRRWARKYYADKLDRDECKVTINEESITILSPTVRTELTWAAFSRCIDTKNVLALVHGGTMYLFPRRAFSEEQWKEFHGLVKRFVPQAL